MSKSQRPTKKLVIMFCAVVATALSSCTTASRIDSPIHESDYSEKIRVACIGDSITFGFGIRDRDHNSYPAQLQKLLGDRWEVRNFGVNGATALKKGTRPYSNQPEFHAALSFKPNVVVIKLGTNDTNAKSWPEHKKDFFADYADIVRSFQELPTKPRIYVCLPVPLFRDRGKDYDTDKILTEEVLPKLKQVAQKKHLPTIDLYAPFEGKSRMFPDGVHPDAKGAAIMAEVIGEKLSGNFKRDVPFQKLNY